MNAVHILRIATGEIEDKTEERSTAAELDSKGGKARAEQLSGRKRREIAKVAPKARWNK